MYVTNPNDYTIVPEPALVAPQNQRSKFLHSRRILKPGAVLFHEGDVTLEVYEVISGVLRLTRVSESGRRQVIAFGFPGDFVGFPKTGRYHTECDALETTELIGHSVCHLEKCIDNPVLHARLMHAALEEIGSMQDHFMMLGWKSAIEKTASFLSVMMERVGRYADKAGDQIEFSLPMSRADIADFLGLKTETISRAFTQLRNAHVITLPTAKHVVVLKPEALLAFAEID